MYQEHEQTPAPDFSNVKLPAPKAELSPLDRSRAEAELQLHSTKVQPAAGSLLDSGHAIDNLARILRGYLAPYNAERVQELDEKCLPPIELLRAMGDDGVLVTGVPLPEFSAGAGLFGRPEVRALLSNEHQDKINKLLAKPEDPAMTALRAEIAKEGTTVGMLRAAIEIPKASSIGVATFLGVNTGLAAQTISKIGTKAQQAAWLNALNNGIFSYGFGLTEAEVGSDPRSLKTTYQKETDAQGNTVYRLNGNKKFIGNAARVVDENGKLVHRGADYLLVYAVDDPEKAPKDRSFRVFMVPRELIGEENIRHTGSAHNKMGLREVNNGDFDLKDVLVPEAFLIGRPDEDIYPKLVGLLDITRLFVGGMGSGSCEATLEIAAKYAKDRVQNGRTLEQYQMVSFPLQDLEAQALAGRLLLYESARLVDKALDQQQRNTAVAVRGLADFQQSAAAVQGVIDALGAHDLERVFRQTAGECERNLQALQGSFRLKSDKKAFAASVTALYDLTRKLRERCTAQGEARKTELKTVKDAYKRFAEIAKHSTNLEEPVRYGTETAMSKLFNTELAEEAAKQAINTLGGRGYLEDPKEGLGLAKRARDAKVTTIYEGASNIQRNIIAQGMLLQELKQTSSGLREALQFMLLKSNATKRFYYSILKNSARTPVERANAAYKYAVVDVLNRYNTALKQIDKNWKTTGVPDQYKNWDAESIDRQKNLLASLPIQARLGLLADIAVQRKLLHLADQHLKQLEKLPGLTEKQKHEQRLLKHFEVMALEKIIELGRKLGSQSLAQREAEYLVTRFDAPA